jgi:uncharacterized membrane protein
MNPVQKFVRAMRLSARRQDAFLAVGLAVLASVVAVSFGSGRRPDAFGWALLLALHVPLAWRRRAPLTVLCVMIPLIAFYHQQEYDHSAPTAASMVLRKLLGGPGGPGVAYGSLPSVASKEWPPGSPGRPGC